MISRRAVITLTALFFALPHAVFSHTIPDDVAIQAFIKPEGPRLHLLVRVPFNALADIIFPTHANGELDLPQAEAMLPGAAKTWISDWVDLYENNILLPQPQVIETRASLSSDNSFASYEEAWAHAAGPGLPASVRLFPDQAMLDVLFDYPIRSDRSEFAMHSRLSRLGVRVVTALQFLPPVGPSRAYRYQGDPGLFELDPLWHQAVQRFFPFGFFQLLRGTDYLLFLLCVALLFRRFLRLIPFIAAFSVAHSITLIASAYNLVPDALWFPVLFETLIAASIVYMAFENISPGTPVGYRWMIACGCGLICGFGLSFSLRQTLQFGGSHKLTSILSFNAGIELGQLLVLVVSIPLLNFLFLFAIPERIGTIFLAALAAHTGWHRMLDRAKWLSGSQSGWPALYLTLQPPVWQGLTISLILASLGFVFRKRMIRPRVRHNEQAVP